MNKDFIQVKALEGELKLSQKRRDLGCTITTKEMIFQRPHTSYHILIDDVVSIIPLQTAPKSMLFEVDDHTFVKTSFSSQTYRIVAVKSIMYTRHGRLERDETEIIVPLSKGFLEYFAKYTSLIPISD